LNAGNIPKEHETASEIIDRSKTIKIKGE